MKNSKKQLLFKFSVLTALFICIQVHCIGNNFFAINTPGYIVQNNKDTIHGTVQITYFDQITGGIKLKGIDEESFHTRVVFKAHGKKKFKCYFPEMLSSFGFSYDSISYVYQRITIQKKSIFKSERQQLRFAREISKKEEMIYFRDVNVVPNPGLRGNQDKYLKYNTHLFRIEKPKNTLAETKDSLKAL